MKKKKYLLDTQSKKGNVLISPVSIWEIALLKKKGRIEIDDLREWKNEILDQATAKMILPTVTDMIDSTLLPDHHKDPFDRLLIAQAINNNVLLVTRDKTITKYERGGKGDNQDRKPGTVRVNV